VIKERVKGINEWEEVAGRNYKLGSKKRRRSDFVILLEDEDDKAWRWPM